MADTIDVLVISDDDVLRGSLRGAMGSQGFRVVEAEDGVEALAMLDVERFAVVVLSLWTPGFTTHHVLEYMRATDARPDVLIMPDHPHGAALPGVASVEAYVPGPVDPDEFRSLAVRMYVLATRARRPGSSTSGTFARTNTPAPSSRRGTGTSS